MIGLDKYELLAIARRHVSGKSPTTEEQLFEAFADMFVKNNEKLTQDLQSIASQTNWSFQEMHLRISKLEQKLKEAESRRD